MLLYTDSLFFKSILTQIPKVLVQKYDVYQAKLQMCIKEQLGGCDFWKIHVGIL